MQAYNKTDQQLHWLSQTIAKANRTYVTSKPDDSHTNLYYDDLDNRILGRWINNGREQVMLTLNLETLDFEWLNSAKEVVLSFSTIGKVTKDIENEMAESLPDIYLNPDGFTDKLHFEIPDYPFFSPPPPSFFFSPPSPPSPSFFSPSHRPTLSPSILSHLHTFSTSHLLSFHLPSFHPPTFLPSHLPSFHLHTLIPSHPPTFFP